MRNTLICTIGTSLFGNIARLQQSNPEHPMCHAKDSKNWKRLAAELIKETPTERLCGAEINSITSIVNSGHLDQLIRLVFLVSDTDDAQEIGETLQYYYAHKHNPIKFEIVEPSVRLEGLNDASVERFQQEGLKNLVRQISGEVTKYGSEAIAINATGGYKAQISFAGMIGQALEIPVYYLFERFSKAIELPPQPVSLDLTLWLTHYPLFDQLNAEEIVDKSKTEWDSHMSSALAAMIDSITDEGVDYISLSAMGQLFHNRCQLQFRKNERNLLSFVTKDETPAHQKKVSLRDDHGKDTLEAFSRKLCQSPYVKSVVNSLPFNPHVRRAIRSTDSSGLIEFVLYWTDKGYGLCVQSTGISEKETNIIAIHLENEFGK
jgi:putative CRISPR-associated protein (TIGR02619 family)